MTDATLRIGLAAARNAPSVAERLETVKRFLGQAAARDVAIVCFPEAYIPGLRGCDFPVPEHDQGRQRQAAGGGPRHGQGAPRGDRHGHGVGIRRPGCTTSRSSISRDGEVVGYQAKNQIPLEEEAFYVPDGRRRLFEVDGVPFGIAICHEGWRYPESVRWAATRGARLVFHPQLTGSDQ